MIADRVEIENSGIVVLVSITYGFQSLLVGGVAIVHDVVLHLGLVEGASGRCVLLRRTATEQHNKRQACCKSDMSVLLIHGL